MCQRTPEHITAAHKEAAKFGASLTWSISKGNHIEGIVTLAGKSRKVFFSKTPSDHNCNWDAKRNVRSALRQLTA